MRAWQISSFGIDSLEFVEKPTPQPGPGEVLVAMHAISLNYRDLLVVKGKYNPRMKLPRIPCSDGAGVVVAVGEGVTSWKAGDRVMGIFMQNWQEGKLTAAKAKGALGGDVDGMLADHVVLKESGLVSIPAHLSFQEAATLPCAAVTAWNALAAGDLEPGATVWSRARAAFPSLRCSLPGCGDCGCWVSPPATRSWSAPRRSGSTPG